MANNMPNAHGILANEETGSTVKPWHFCLKSKHFHGVKEKVLTDARFPIDGADSHIPTVVHSDYITDAEVSELLNNPGVSVSQCAHTISCFLWICIDTH
jgi:hypothetical protein